MFLKAFNIVLTMSFKLVSFFTFTFAVLLPRVGECVRVSNVVVGCSDGK